MSDNTANIQSENRRDPRRATQVDFSNPAAIYSRWTAGTDDEYIERTLIADDIVTTGKAFGAWADRASLTYTAIQYGG
jgi:hypothetical protein